MLIKMRCEIKDITYRNNKSGFTVAKVKIKKHPANVEIPTVNHIIRGYFCNINNKDEFELEGKWIFDEKRGYQFEVENLSLLFPETGKGIVEFLRKYIAGVGRITATRAEQKFGIETYDVILNRPKELISAGITEKKAMAMHKGLKEYKEYENVMSTLMKLGLGHEEAFLVYKRLGFSAIEKIKENPYVLASYDVDLRSIDIVAKKLGFLPNNSKRIKTGILMFIENQMKNRGDMFVYEKDILEKLPQFLCQYGGFNEDYTITNDEIKMSLNLLTIDKKIVIEDIECDYQIVYIAFYKFIEDKIVKYLDKMINAPTPHICYARDIDAFINSYELKTGLELAEKQKDAIFMIMSNQFSVLSGGPGTGKTQTINTIINCFKTIKPNAIIELAAPTGRAAKRMTELTGMEAKTIHRLIGLNNFLEEKVELEEIEADFLIIDEASMIDAYVFYSLLSVIPETTKVLIVGDYQQLPSVGAGLVLRDLIDSRVVETTILTEVFRQKEGSQIIENAHKVINGDKNLSLDNNKGDFYFLNQPIPKKIVELMILSIKRLLETGYKLEDIQVLSVFNEGDLGVAELNKIIQGEFNPKYLVIPEIKISDDRCLRLHDKVMQTVNNYNLGVFNGEVGVIKYMNQNDEEVIVDFGDKEVTYNMDTISELTLAYAITVHKSQGSEFDAVIMLFHSSLGILLNRNTIYTGLTRAKKRVICIGDKTEFNNGINRIGNIERNSRIKEKLNKC